MRVAVMGPAYTGKTTLARELESRGFHFSDYTGYLKVLTAQALSAIGLPTSVTDIVENKTFFRALLQDMGTVLDFDNGAFVEELVKEAGDAEHIVFDNVRFIGQWEKLAPLGFTLAYLAITPMEQEVRAREAGLSAAELGKVMRHPTEVGFPLPADTIVLPHEWTTANKADSLIAQLTARQNHVG